MKFERIACFNATHEVAVFSGEKSEHPVCPNSDAWDWLFKNADAARHADVCEIVLNAPAGEADCEEFGATFEGDCVAFRVPRGSYSRSSDRIAELEQGLAVVKADREKFNRELADANRRLAEYVPRAEEAEAALAALKVRFDDTCEAGRKVTIMHGNEMARAEEAEAALAEEKRAHSFTRQNAQIDRGARDAAEARITDLIKGKNELYFDRNAQRERADSLDAALTAESLHCAEAEAAVERLAERNAKLTAAQTKADAFERGLHDDIQARDVRISTLQEMLKLAHAFLRYRVNPEDLGAVERQSLSLLGDLIVKAVKS